MKTCKTFNATIWIAGAVPILEQECRRVCLGGLCVTVTPTNFIYTGGEQTGAAIGLINYPRFPQEPESIKAKALDLATHLMDAAVQRSCSVVFPDETVYLENPAIQIPR